MTRLGEIARIKLSGRTRSDVSSRARLVWEYMRDQAANKQGGIEQVNGETGDAGLQFRGTVRAVIRQLWPLTNGWNSDEYAAFETPILEYLRRSGNARCIVNNHGNRERGRPAQNVWWVRADWATAAPDILRIARVPLTSTERRLTPEEAGETRPPAPVVVRRQATTPATPATPATGETNVTQPDPMPPETEASYRNTAGLASARSERAKEYRAQIGDPIDLALASASEPVTIREIAEYLGLGRSIVRTYVNAQIENRHLFHRTETLNERHSRAGEGARARIRGSHAKLIWPTEPVPERTLREVFPGVHAKTLNWDDLSSRDRATELLRVFADAPAPGMTTHRAMIAVDIGSVTVRARVQELLGMGLIEANVATRTDKKVRKGATYYVASPLGRSVLLAQDSEDSEPRTEPVEEERPLGPIDAMLLSWGSDVKSIRRVYTALVERGDWMSADEVAEATLHAISTVHKGLRACVNAGLAEIDSTHRVSRWRVRQVPLESAPPSEADTSVAQPTDDPLSVAEKIRAALDRVPAVTMDALRKEVDDLTNENRRLTNENQRLRSELANIAEMLKRRGIE